MELWSLKEVAKRTSTSEAFWRKQVHLKQVAVIKVGRLVRLDAEAVRAFLVARTRPARKVGK